LTETVAAKRGASGIWEALIDRCPTGY